MADTTLKKHLTMLDVYAFSLGPMLSSGIFLLPSMMYSKVGPLAILAYLVAGLLIVPALLSKAELATAMPRAGGTYYFIDRSLGPFVGTIAGLGTWLALSFKSAFDLIGLGAYLVLFLSLPVKPVAIGLTVLFAVLSIGGVKKVGRFQVILVGILLGFLAYFISKGMFHLDLDNFQPFFDQGTTSFLGAVGLVYVGFTGLTKVASVAEEVDNPEHNIPLGMLLALGTTILIYLAGMIIIVGVTPGKQLASTLTPISTTAELFMGPVGATVMSVAAVLAFTASANAGLTAASRYPLAMGRDNLAPAFLKKLGRYHTPTNSILITSGLMMCFILVLSPMGIAKLASAFQLLLFGLINLAVIVMRESKIDSYDPGFRSVAYPWFQIIGVLSAIILIPELGVLPVIFSGVLIGVSIFWYIFYGQKRIERGGGAMLHVFERMGKEASPDLDQELRQILKEKGLRKEDAFEDSILTAAILFQEPEESFDDLILKASGELAKQLEVTDKQIFDALSETNQMGETPIGSNIALPHARLEGVNRHALVIVHSEQGIVLDKDDEPVYALFILISPKEDPGQHLRFLAELANRAEGIDFAEGWRTLDNPEDIRNRFVRSGEVAELHISRSEVVGKRIRDIRMHEKCLIALITREGSMIVPHGDTTIEQGDKLTIIGEENAVEEMVGYFKRKAAE